MVWVGTDHAAIGCGAFVALSPIAASGGKLHKRRFCEWHMRCISDIICSAEGRAADPSSYVTKCHCV
jgi:hypothetical protein